MNRSFYARLARPIVITLIVLSGPLLFGAWKALRSSNNNIHQWLPESFEETRTYDSFRSVFGADDFVLASWEGCTLDDPRIEKFAQAVLPPAGTRREEDGSHWFEKVVTGPRTLQQLTEEPFNLPRKEALRRLEGTLVGPNHKMTCALITLSEAGDRNRGDVLKTLRKIAWQECQIEPDQLRLGGDAVINAAIDIDSQQAIRTWITLSWGIALVVACWCLRSLKLTLMIFLVASYSSVLATAAVYYTGGSMNLVLVVVPILIYVLPLSAAVHLSNYYRDAIRESGPDGAPVRAVAAGWSPCVLAALTTAMGLVSLYVSHIVPVKMFGIYAALGIMLSLVIIFLLFPVLLEIWPLTRLWNPAAKSTISRDRRLHRIAEWLIHHRRPVTVSCLALLVFLGSGVALVRTSVTPGRFLAPGSKWISDANWLQERLGPWVPIEIVIGFDEECPMDHVGRMEVVRRVDRMLHGFEEIGGTISAATFGPLTTEFRTPLRRRVADVRLRRSLNHPAASRYFHANPKEELWRISARVKAFRDVPHDEFLGEVKRRVDGFIQEEVPSADTVHATYTGVVPLVFLAQRELFEGLFKSFYLAFVMIAVVMALLLRSLKAGLLAMLPNIFPAAVTFGVMGWTSTFVDVGSMMTASVAMGIAVDGTLHYLTWFRRALKQGQSRQDAIVYAYERCAAAITQTTLIAGLGLLVLCLSSFQPISQFGLLMFILLAAALVGDLVLLPAMLATRLGKVFQERKPPAVEEEPPVRRKVAACSPQS
ncbi:MAG: hypothetical protein A2V70_07020 [Planctomycetes bacterium RBG_13_63_9]|nr:MAG: hypothetical protein A2V70_07020 [Planctomycetes bacterium RBG_13_63_9]